MPALQQEIQVCFRYPVHFTTDLFAPENPLFAQVTAEGGAEGRRKVLFVIDEGVNRHHPGLGKAIATYCRRHGIPLIQPLWRVPGGEEVKNQHDWVLTLHHAIEQAGLCRHSFLAAVGGGAVLDMAGLAAATAHRGVRLIRIPTTVLSQNDSGVGVKNGINAFGKKNFLGTFAPPFAVLNDSRFLTTLSDRDWRSGIAEAIKVALIKDAAFFEWLEEHVGRLRLRLRLGPEGTGSAVPNPNPNLNLNLNRPAPDRDLEAMQRLIYRCAELHLQHIATSGDPFEMGSARPLDFGHWSAHKLEQLSGYRLRHGEAVAIGIALDTTYSYLSGLISEADWQRVLHLLIEYGFALHAPELDEAPTSAPLMPGHPRSILQGLREFREHLGGELTITLLEGIGRGIEVHEIDEERMVESIARLRKGVGCSVLGVRADDPATQHRTPNTQHRIPCRAHVSSKGEARWKPAPSGPRARAQ